MLRIAEEIEFAKSDCKKYILYYTLTSIDVLGIISIGINVIGYFKNR